MIVCNASKLQPKRGFNKRIGGCSIPELHLQSYSCCFGYNNCDNDLGNGCETHTYSDPNHCSSCNNVCSGNPPNSSPTCVSGTCGFSCNAGFSQCSSECFNLATDNNHCGSCGTVCTGTTCCGGNCLDTSNNLNNCGGCGNVCPSTNGTPSCTAGVCSIVCDAGFTNCEGSCVDIHTDLNNCGRCGEIGRAHV